MTDIASDFSMNQSGSKSAKAMIAIPMTCIWLNRLFPDIMLAQNLASFAAVSGNTMLR
jgi:hypothetical protein